MEGTADLKRAVQLHITVVKLVISTFKSYIFLKFGKKDGKTKTIQIGMRWFTFLQCLYLPVDSFCDDCLFASHRLCIENALLPAISRGPYSTYRGEMTPVTKL